MSAADRHSQRMLAGAGRFIARKSCPDGLHLAVLRSPQGGCRIDHLDLAAARACEGVQAVYGFADLPEGQRHIAARLGHISLTGEQEQPLLADGQTRFQGEAVAAVLAESRALAEDALEAIELSLSPADIEPPAGSLAFERVFAAGTMPKTAATSLSLDFQFARQAGVALEPRGLVAEFDAGSDQLTVWQNHQSPHMMRALYARLLGLPEASVRVITGDVGGAFGVKLHAYADDMLAVLLARLAGRPVSFQLDRLESFVSDAHARHFDASARLDLDGQGRICGLQADYTNHIGAYGLYPRSSVGDAVQCGLFSGAAYQIPACQITVRSRWQHRPPTGAIRGVGQPIPCSVTEQLMDAAARATGQDPLAFRLAHLAKDRQSEQKTPAGVPLGKLSLAACLEKLAEEMGYQTLRERQTEALAKGELLGIGLISFIEQTSPGPGLYGPAELPVTAEDRCEIRAGEDGSFLVLTGATDQGQGTLGGIVKIVAAELGCTESLVQIRSGDSDLPIGGGAWASRGLAIAGEAALLAAQKLKSQILGFAGHIHQCPPETLQLKEGRIEDSQGKLIAPLAEICQLALYRQDLYPPPVGGQAVVCAEAGYMAEAPHFIANGAQGSLVSIDEETGFVRLLHHWVVEDCGPVMDAKRVDEQIRGGVVQGLGAVLFEECRYEGDQLLNASFADYLVPMAGEMPDISISHIETRHAHSQLGIKGVGEAGTIGAPAAVWSAVNDALALRGCRINQQPFTPQAVLAALGKIP